MYIFEPMSEEEIELSSLIDEGVYDFEVTNSVKKLSKSNNPMAELILKIWDKEGKTRVIYDYLVFSKVPLNIKKVKHFCDATGLIKDYEKGQIREELGGLSGKVHIGIQDERPKEGGGVYPKKNIVIDYVVTDKGATKVPLEALSDDIPF